MSSAEGGSDRAELFEQFETWVHAHYGPSSTVGELVRLSGHSGISYAFDVSTGEVVDRLVIRIAPPGVRLKNNTDVLRVAPLLSLLHGESLPVPAVRFIGDDPQWFGSPFLVVERLSGATMPDVFVDHAAADLPDRDLVDRRYVSAIAALTGLHAVATERAPHEWGEPRSLTQEVDIWMPLLRKASDASWTDKGMAVYRMLLETTPPASRTVIQHGDFYSNNWLFEASELTGLLDWENTAVGPAQSDLAWLCAINDPQVWGEERREHMGWLPGPDFIIDCYEDVAGRELEYFDWYRALANFKLACATALNLRLHETGRRIDPVWEVFGEAFHGLMNDALCRLEP